MVKIKATLNDFGSLALVWIMSDGGVRSDTDANNASHEEGKGQRWTEREGRLSQLWIAEELAYKKRQHIKCPQTDQRRNENANENENVE